jgi:hypothetical protein
LVSVFIEEVLKEFKKTFFLWGALPGKGRDMKLEWAERWYVLIGLG